ncbi:hypothetical protein GpartN1_g1797.t1 [Galdieria partita]|uniref:PA14 domain-containing protein n=1 Tax=Galdieria partita TaxID=83374 RepID=A0A9C7PUA9_9RHOD|nr:hypothetical protein GpartN1_g1797.t1 [Galdieria partita]
MAMEKKLFLVLFFLTFFLCYLSLRRGSISAVLSIAGSSPLFGKITSLVPRLEWRERIRASQSSYPSISFLSSQIPYYASEYSLDSSWTTPVFSYAAYEHFNYSVVTVPTLPGAGESIFFNSEFSIDSSSQYYLLTVLGNEMFYVYLNGEFVEAQQYPMYINRTISIAYGGKFRLAAQVVSSGVHIPFLYVKMIGQQDGKYYIHSTSNPSAWNWYVNEGKIVPGMINITMAMETRELYEVGTTGVSVFNSSYSHDRWPVAQTHNFYELFSGEIQVIGPGEDRQPFGTYFVFAQFEIDTTGSYKVTLRADDGAYVYLDSKRFATIVKNDNLTSYTITLTSGTHFLVAQVMNNGQGDLEVLPNGSGLGNTGLLCRIASENSGSSAVLKSTSGYYWRILSYPSVLPSGYL